MIPVRYALFALTVLLAAAPTWAREAVFVTNDNDEGSGTAGAPPSLVAPVANPALGTARLAWTLPATVDALDAARLSPAAPRAASSPSVNPSTAFTF